MRAKAEWHQGEQVAQQYDTLSDSGHHLTMDADSAHAAGPSPMEAVLMALCACTSVDVVSILKKKRQPLASLTVSAEAEQAPAPPRVFTHIRLTYRVSGNVDAKAMQDAVELSKNKYCSVSMMLEKSAQIEFNIEHAGEERADGAGSVPASQSPTAPQSQAPPR